MKSQDGAAIIGVLLGISGCYEGYIGNTVTAIYMIIIAVCLCAYAEIKSNKIR